jgi:hypothetical protein
VLGMDGRPILLPEDARQDSDGERCCCLFVSIQTEDHSGGELRADDVLIPIRSLSSKRRCPGILYLRPVVYRKWVRGTHSRIFHLCTIAL